MSTATRKTSTAARMLQMSACEFLETGYPDNDIDHDWLEIVGIFEALWPLESLIQTKLYAWFEGKISLGELLNSNFTQEQFYNTFGGYIDDDSAREAGQEDCGDLHAI